MDDLDPVRVLIAELIGDLEDAISDALPAQDPRAGAREIQEGLDRLRQRLQSMSRKLGEADQTFDRSAHRWK